MKKLRETLAISQNLSTLAGEEASKSAELRVGPHHVLLALTRWDSPVSRELRAGGVTEQNVRAAIADGREEDLRLLGFDSDVPPTPAGTPLPAKKDWDPLALEAISSAARRRDGRAALEVLASSEDTSFRGLLDRLGLDLAQLAIPSQEPDEAELDGRSLVSATSIFVPVDAESAMAHVADPRSRMSWDTEFGGVEEQDDGSWVRTTPDQQHAATLTVEVEQPRTVVWRSEWREGTREEERFTFSDSGDGTSVSISTRWTQVPGARSTKAFKNPLKKALDQVVADQRTRRTGANLRAALSD